MHFLLAMSAICLDAVGSFLTRSCSNPLLAVAPNNPLTALVRASFRGFDRTRLTAAVQIFFSFTPTSFSRLLNWRAATAVLPFLRTLNRGVVDGG